LLQEGFGIDVIMRSTDLSKEHLEELKKDILEEKDVINLRRLSIFLCK